MSAWKALNPNGFLPTSLTSALQGNAALLQAAALPVVSPTRLLARLPALPVPPDPTATVITAVLDTLQALLASGQIHVLSIPIARQDAAPRNPVLPASMDNLAGIAAAQLGPTTADTTSAYANLRGNTGGNAGFYQDFVAALNNPLDPNRPQYTNASDAVFMAVVMVGAPTLAPLNAAAATLSVLTRPVGGADLTANIVPVPNDVKAKVISTPSQPRIGVRLTWRPANIRPSRYFPRATFQISRFAVIRSTDMRVLQARTVLDIFATDQLTEGLTVGGNTVLKVGAGFNTTYLDTAPIVNKPSYYVIAWECHCTEAGVTTTLPFGRLSASVKISAPTPTPANTGQRVAWRASANVLGAFPRVERTVQLLLDQARAALPQVPVPNVQLTKALTLTAEGNARIAARAAELLDDAARLATSLARPIPSMYQTQMTSARGGNAYLMTELARRLGDTTDTSRPPFDSGEYVCGLCFVAGASRLADLADIIALFGLLFNVPTPDRAIVDVLNVVDTLVTQAENAVFADDGRPVSSSVDAPLDPLTGRPPAASAGATSITDTGAPARPADATNPNAGFTNRIDLATLC